MDAFDTSLMSNMAVDAALNNIATFETKTFMPAAFLDDSPVAPFPYVLLVLNTPIHKGELFEKCCTRSLAVIAADGGGNRIYEYCKDGSSKPYLVNKLRPETIVGDLDSLTSEAEKFFKERGTTIIQDEDKYSTDFTKSLQHIARHRHWWLDLDNRKHGRAETQLKVLVYGGLGGRADQAFSQLHHLYSAAREPTLGQLDLYLLTGESIIFLLPEGGSIIDTPLSLLGENVGIIPMGRPAVISTIGLEWDVQGWQTEFGGQISTSNHIRAPQVLITASERVIFTVEIHEHLHGLQGGAPIMAL